GIGNPLWFEWPRMFIFAVYVRVLFEDCQEKSGRNICVRESTQWRWEKVFWRGGWAGLLHRDAGRGGVLGQACVRC
ncbi:MAG TPA: hypothetical protein VIL86_17455, partial [Tepidisphaeraceae bacterium]